MKKRIVIFLCFSGLLCSCSHYYYVSNIQNVPLFHEKKEYRLSGGYGFGDESQSIEIQAAYAVGNKVGIAGNFMSAWGGDVSGHDYGKGNYIDLGIGYYLPVNAKSVFELYGGVGGSSQHHGYSGLSYSQGTFSSQNYGSSDLSFMKIYIQPSFGMMFNVFDIAVSTRISNVSYTNIGNYAYGNTYIYDELNTLKNKSHFFIEPALTLRCGWKRIKIQLQGAYADYLNRPKMYFGEEAHLSLGIYYAFTGGNK
jgi:hypothetical protein